MAENYLASTAAVGKILDGRTLSTVSADVYTVPAATGCVVKKGIVCNTSAAAATFTLSVTKSGGSAVVLFSAYSVLPGDTVDLTELVGLCLGPADKLSAFAGTSSAIRLLLSGTENS